MTLHTIRTKQPIGGEIRYLRRMQDDKGVFYAMTTEQNATFFESRIAAEVEISYANDTFKGIELTVKEMKL